MGQHINTSRSPNKEICEQCGATFHRKPSYFKKNKSGKKYCGRACESVGRTKLESVRCGYCGKQYDKKPCLIKRCIVNYCSKLCGGLARKKADSMPKPRPKKRRIVVECEICKAPLERLASRLSRSDKIFCSIECRATGTKTQIEVTCDCCKKPFLKRPSVIKNNNFCSRICQQQVQRAEDQRTWVERAGGRPATLYLIRLFDDNESFYKVGVTISSVAKRYQNKKELAGYEYEIVATHTSSSALRIYEWEQSLLETFSNLKYTPSRQFAGWLECISDAGQILSIFPL